MRKPLFLLAPPRSFTSIVCAMVGNHPEMYGLPETNLFMADTVSALNRIHQAQWRLRFGLLRAVAELGLGEQTGENVDSASEWLAEESDCSTSAVFADLAEWAAPRRLVEKSPMHVFAPGAIQRMHAAFPEAYYLHLLREPRGTCESIHKSGWAIVDGGRRAAPNPDKVWLKAHLGIIDALQSVPANRQLTLRGEDLLQAPAAHMAHIARWLDIDSSDEAIDAMLHPERSPFACVGPHNAPTGNDIEFLNHPELRPFTASTVDLDSPLSWDDTLHFSPDVLELAAIFGYRK